MIKQLALLLAAGLAAAQAPNQVQSVFVNLPEASQRAVAIQRLGTVDVTITYHRPLTYGRKVFGGIVPYGQVWRAGANESTTIEFSDKVSIDGHSLEKGIYGLHMIPTEKEWTIIFSNNSTQWGSFFYDQKEDALRITTTPASSEKQDALVYEFNDLKQDSTRVTLRWDRTAVSFPVKVNFVESALTSIRNQLRGAAAFNWMSHNDATEWCLENKVNYEEASRWIDRSVTIEERFENLETKSRLLVALGKESEGKTVKEKAFAKAGPLQLHNYGRGLQNQGKPAEAFEVFRLNAKRNPEFWVVHIGMSRVYSAEKNFPAAVKEMQQAIAGSPNAPQTAALEGLLRRLNAGQDINQ